MSKVAIVIPCYNASRFIQTTLDSVLAQDFDEWECVVVDDGSLDNSANIVGVTAQRDPRVTLVQQANQGVHAARCTGARQASPISDYLVFLDADDTIEPSFVRTLSSHLDRYPGVGLVYCQYSRIDETGLPLDSAELTEARFVPGRRRIRSLGNSELETPLEALVSRHEAIPSTCMLRRSVYECSRGWRAAGVIEDKDIVMQVALLSVVHFLPERLSNYRQHDHNRSSSKFYESMEELHRMWWDDSTLSSSDLDRVRRAIIFDKRLSALFALRGAVQMVREGRFRNAVEFALRSLARYVAWLVLSARRCAGRIK